MSNNGRRNTQGKGTQGNTRNDKQSGYNKGKGGSAYNSNYKTPKGEGKQYSKPNTGGAKPKTNPDEIRLNKYIGNSGMCSRRDADIYIQSGNVKVNGEVVTEMGYKVKLSDKVEFDGVNITPEKKEYILINKPKNFATSGDGEAGMRNIVELVRSATNAKLRPVGRMDKNTTGLLLLTNDSDMERKFSQPNQKSFKIYQVTLGKSLKFEDLEKLNGGVVHLGEHRLFVDEVSYVENEPKTEIGIKLRTPNVKVVRSIFESFGYDVVKVDRVVFAGLTKKNLPRGNFRFLTEQEIINLKNI